MPDSTVRVGIGGWTYAPWRGEFYPPGLAHSKEQAFAAASFGAIEINSTFYGRQSPASWAKWAAAAPDGFQYSVKASRYCVTRPKLADAGEGIGNFYAQGLSGLGDRLGPTLWMLSRHRQFDRDDIAAFLDILPDNLDGRPLRHVIEPRHESFRHEAFFDLARAHNVAVVFGDDDEFPCIDADTASFAYARLQRMREDVSTGYDAAALDAFAERAKRWSEAGLDSYIFMINGSKVRAPAAALALQARLGIASR
jgi:uncharacterized protein YecE (DUF72 family)